MKPLPHPPQITKTHPPDYPKSKKYRPEFCCINSYQRIIACDFYSKIEKGLSSVTPFFLNQTSTETKYSLNQFKLPYRKSKNFYNQMPKRITKPLEVRNRTFISIYKNDPVILQPVKICSGYVLLDLQKYRQYSFFYKINSLQTNFRNLILNKYKSIFISNQKKIKNQQRDPKKKIHRYRFGSLVFWTSFLNYYLEKPFNEISLELFSDYNSA